METKYGDMGNSIRDKHKARRGDFVMFADDDNWCVSACSRAIVVSYVWGAVHEPFCNGTPRL